MKTENNITALPTREQPYNIEAEQALLGAILTDNKALDKVPFVKAEHFYEPLHGRIYDAIVESRAEGKLADAITLKVRFDKDEALKELGANYLVKIAGLASGIVNVRDYALIVYSLSTSRDLIDIGSDMVSEAFDSDGTLPASRLIEKYELALHQLTEVRNDKTFFSCSVIEEVVEDWKKATESSDGIIGVSSGIQSLDNKIGGFAKSNLIILAARPSMGKTGLATTIALNASKGHKVAFFSLEMSRKEIVRRLWSLESGVSMEDIQRGRIANNQNERLCDGIRAFHNTNFIIDDTAAQTISAICSRARTLKRRHDISLIVIDYLQLIRGVSGQARNNRVQEVSEISAGLKALAKDLDIPVIALSQLSRQVEGRDDKHPRLSDLRDSGTIEQDADIVMFLYREAYYLAREKVDSTKIDKVVAWKSNLESVQNDAELDIAKNRNGAIGMVKLTFDKETVQFTDRIDDGFSREGY